LKGYDEPETLSYAIRSICPIGADGGHLTPADVYFGRGQVILMEREKIKRQTIEHRRLQHRKNAA